MATKHHQIDDALQRAYALRYAEVGQYWQRALYFWGFTGFLLVVFVLLWQDMGSGFANRVGLMALPVLGFFIAWAWYFTERGAQSWQASWENYIAYLEGGVTRQRRAKLLQLSGVSAISQTHLSLFYIVASLWLVLPLLAVRPFMSDLLAYDDPGIWGWMGLCLVAVLVIYSFVRGYFENYLKMHAKTRVKPPGLHFKHSQLLTDMLVFFVLTMFAVWPFLNYLEGFEELNIFAWLGVYFVPVVIICMLGYDWMRKHWRGRAEVIGRIHRFFVGMVVVMWVGLVVVSGRELYGYSQARIAEFVPLEYLTERCSVAVIENVEGIFTRAVIGGLCHFLQSPQETISGIERIPIE